MNQTIFYNEIRSSLFGGGLGQDQVIGINSILSYWSDIYDGDDERWLAYALATAYKETGRTMQPIREWGEGRGKVYGQPDPITHQTYYGRGFVQLTWKANYAKMGAKIGVNLVNDPDLAMIPVNAAKILLMGMAEGDFTGKKLSDYFSQTENDPFNARRIINGTDCAEEIVGYHTLFLHAIDQATPIQTTGTIS